jgi:3-hydroxypropanoate dehydrogenase
MGPSTSLHPPGTAAGEDDLSAPIQRRARLSNEFQDSAMSEALNDAALKQLFTEARTFNKFQATAIDDAALHALVDLMKWGPTSMNSQPGRIVFVRSAEAKEKLKGALMGGNVDKTIAAPVTAIVAYDTEFHEHLPTQFAAMPGARDMFHGNTGLIETTGLRNSSLQGAYLILAARALGIDSGAMSGFNNAAVDAAFFPEGKWKSNFLINLGYGDASGNWPRGPRLPFETMARID